MVAMSSAIRISCALVVIVMVICSATTVATSESTSVGVALTTLHSSHAPAAIKRHLKRTTAMAATEISEERMLTFSIPGMDSIFSILKSIPATIHQQSQRWMWWLAHKSSDEVFQLLELNELANFDTEKRIQLFEDPRFMQWVTFVNEKYPKDPKAATKAILKTLVKHYGEDVAFFDVLLAGTEIPITKELASELMKTPFLKWINAGKSVEEFFTFLKLESLGDRLFESPRFKLWLKFIGAHLKAEKAKTYKSAKKVAKKLNNEADKAAKAAMTANETDKPDLQEAEKLAAEKADRAKQAVDEAKKAVDEAKDAVDKTSKVFIEAILPYLRNHFKDDLVLSNVLAKGLTVNSKKMKFYAQELLSLQLYKWAESGKTSSEQFTLLKLETMGNELFKSPLFLQWVSFVKLEHSNDYTAAYKDVLSTLKKHYGEDNALAGVLVAGTEIPDVQQLAFDLLLTHFSTWLEAGKSVEQVFTYLGLENSGVKLFENPRFDLWLFYFGPRSLPQEDKAFKLASGWATEAADKAAMATETADEVDTRVLEGVKLLADMELQKARYAYDKAYGSLAPRLLSFLRAHYNDTVLKSVLEKGVKVDNKSVKGVAKELLNMLNKKTNGQP